MPGRAVLARELSDLLKAIAHPDRVRLIEELRGGALDVTAMSEKLDLPATRISQHLAVLRAHRLVDEHREGRRHHYHLADPGLAVWLLDGVKFIEGRVAGEVAAQRVIETAKNQWRAPAPDAANN